MHYGPRMGQEEERGYITIHPAVGYRKFNVVIMQPGRGEEMVIQRISSALPDSAARALARDWATATGLEVR